MVKIIELAVPSADATALEPNQRAFARLARDADLIVYGHGDFSESDEATLESWKSTKFWTSQRFLALTDSADPADPHPSEVLGNAFVQFPLQENKHLAFVYLWVQPHARGRGIGTALKEALREAILASGRSTAQVWVTGAVVPQDAPGAIVPPTGFGAVDGKLPAIRWLLELGFQFEQVERISTLTIPPAGPDREEWLAGVLRFRDHAAAHASGYRLVTWTGPTPEHHLEGMAQLRRRMSVDMPTGGLSFDADDFTAERIAYNDQRALAKGMIWVTVAAVAEAGGEPDAGGRSEARGELVAYTVLEWPRPDSEGIWQEDTFVHGEHRGHRLGMLIKAEMLLGLHAHNPRAARIHTWNADENSFMLSINQSLGFVPVGYESAWELRGIAAPGKSVPV